MKDECLLGDIPSPVLDILEATFTVSPKTLYRGIVVPTIPAAQGPANYIKS